MIRLLVGDNDFEKARTLREIVAASKLTAEKYDGASLNLAQLPDLIMGATLFSPRRLVIIRDLSENAAVWPKLADMLDKVSDDIDLVLVETSPDKRTSTYKKLAQAATVIEHAALTERDFYKAVDWLMEEAAKLKIKLGRDLAELIARRVGPDQWQLFHALEKLSLVDSITREVIESVIDANPTESVFGLLELAVEGDRGKLKATLDVLETTEDPHRLLALLSTQAFQLAAVATAGNDNPAKDFGIHPYVAGRLKKLASSIGRQRVGRIVRLLAEADDNLKTSKAEPWMLIEQVLLKIAAD